MATLAEAVDAAETDWLVSEDITADFLTVESETVSVLAHFPAQYQMTDGSVSPARIRVARGAGGTTAASHSDGTTITPLIPPAGAGGGGLTVDNGTDPPAEVTTLIAPGAVIDGSEAMLPIGTLTLRQFGPFAVSGATSGIGDPEGIEIATIAAGVTLNDVWITGPDVSGEGTGSLQINVQDIEDANRLICQAAVTTIERDGPGEHGVTSMHFETGGPTVAITELSLRAVLIGGDWTLGSAKIYYITTEPAA